MVFNAYANEVAMYGLTSGIIDQVTNNLSTAISGNILGARDRVLLRDKCHIG